MEFVPKIRHNHDSPPDMVHFRIALLSFAGLTLCAVPVDGSPSRNAGVRVNVAALDWAATLIAQGHFVADKKGAWRNDHPTRSQENDFAHSHGFPEYSKWYLAVDERHAQNSKARYKFPFGDFQKVHRCGLLAIKSRAREFGYHEIEAAAAKLLAMIDQSTHALKNASTNSGKSSL
jgi:hypothetical protein